MRNIDIGFWEILIICLTAIFITGMFTGHGVSFDNNGCIAVKK